jgi:hypothetical protein
VLRLARDRSRLPAAFVHEARRCLAHYAEGVAAHGPTSIRQFAELVWCRVCYGLDPIAYYRYQLFRRERQGSAGQFVQTHDVGRLLTWLIHSSRATPSPFSDKRTFARWCAEHDLPRAGSLAEFAEGRLSERFVLSLPPADLFSKPSNLQGGKGAERWTLTGSNEWVSSSSGARCSETALFDHLAEQSLQLGRPILLQRRLSNHRALAQLVPNALCTVRMVTTRALESPAQLVIAAYRMPIGDAVADNFDGGGIAAPVDLTTGRLGCAMRKYPLVAGPYEVHPTSGARIEGLELPFWSEAVSLVARAHDAATPGLLPVLGWDVALTDEGPLLLEGNDLPCSTLAQLPGGIPLGATPVVANINAHLHHRFNAEPQPTLRFVGSWVRKFEGSLVRRFTQP